MVKSMGMECEYSPAELYTRVTGKMIALKDLECLKLFLDWHSKVNSQMNSS